MIRAAEPSRYAPARVALLAGAFLLVAPVYWLSVQHPGPPPGSDATLFGDIARLGWGYVPHWDDSLLAGRPYLADPSHGLFQPLNAVFAILPEGPARAWHASLCLFLMGFLFALFLRSLGARYTSAFGGGMAYACSGLAAGALSQPQTLAALAWAPLALWAVNEYGVSFRFRTAILAGFAFALLLLSGSVTLAASIAVVALIYGILIVLSPSGEEAPPLGRRMAGLAIAAAAAVGLTAFQWLPSLYWALTLSGPGASFASSGTPGIAVRGAYDFLAQTVAAAGATSTATAYIGAAGLPLLAASLFHVSRRPVLYFAVVTLLAAGTAATGTAGSPLALPVWTLGACVLAGLGLDAVTAPGRDFRSPYIWGPLAMFLSATAVILFVSPPGAIGRLAIGLVVVLACAVLRSRVASPVFTTLYAALLLFDLSAANSHAQQRMISVTAPRASENVLVAARELVTTDRVLVANPDAIAVPEHSESILRLPRTLDVFQRMPDEQARWWMAMFGDLRTTDANPIAEWTEWPHPALLNHLAVRVVVAPVEDTPPAEWEKAGLTLRLHDTQDDTGVYVNETSMPRAYWAPRWRHVPDAETARGLLLEPGFVEGDECAVEGSVPEPETAGGRDSLAMTPCTLEAARPGSARVLADAPADGIVVVANAFAPGWRATVDGRPVEVLRVNGMFCGVAVGKGPHLILFHYISPGWYAGCALSLVALLGLLAGAVWPNKA